MLLFRSEEHVTRWSKLWKLRRGATLSLEQGLRLAQAWYSNRLERDWHPKPPQQAEALFARLGLRSRFWRMSR